MARLPTATVFWLALATAACGARTALDDGRRATPGDAEPGDGGDADGWRPDADALCLCASDPDCDDGDWCNGVERCDEGTCTCLPGAPPDCDDGVACTIDGCAPAGCTHDLDHGACPPGTICDAVEGCVGRPCDRDEDCDDGEACSEDYCDVGAGLCGHRPRDRDGDGHGDAACGGTDCDDLDPTVHPGRAEVCDGLDQDCDGIADEGVLSECGDCRLDCHVTSVPAGPEGWAPTPEDSERVGTDPEGRLVLDTERVSSTSAWIANHLYGTVSRLDTRTGDEVARYVSAVPGTGNHARPPGEVCAWEGAEGNCPSRTAVDSRGDVWIANRAFFSQGTVTKIASLEADCVDRNGNGVIDTSRDLDGDGEIDPESAEFLGEDDECILFTVDVGGVNDVPRAVAVDAGDDVWVGLYEAQVMVQLSGADGHELTRVPMELHPYGAAIDSRGRLWAIESGAGVIQMVDTTTARAGELERAPAGGLCFPGYGVAIDGEDRVWMSSFCCDAAFRFEPDRGWWTRVELPGAGLGRGIAVDDEGMVWMASSHESCNPATGEMGEEIARLTAFDAETGEAVTHITLPGAGSVGVGIDFEGGVWVVNQSTDDAVRFDPATGLTTVSPVGVSPYTYSDFTGYAFATFTAPSGSHRVVIEGCPGATTVWERASWEATTPAGTRLEIRARTAASRSALSSARWIGPWTSTPADLLGPPGPLEDRSVLELELRLFSDDERHTPAVERVDVQYFCP